MGKINQSNNGLVAVVALLQNLLALELWRAGVSQAEIGKRLGIATATVNKMLKGVSRNVRVLVDTNK
jgi:predicted transcriptional regulator